MGSIPPYDQKNPDQWRKSIEKALHTVHDDALKAIIRGVLNMHELEKTGEWKISGRRIDYSNSTFETYLQHHTTWSLKDFRLLEEVVFKHFEELKSSGMRQVLQRLKRLKKERNPLAERRRKKRGKR